MSFSPESLSVLIGGVVAILAASVSGIFSWISARSQTRWSQAKSDLMELCDQVVAYHKLEALYKQEIAKLDPERGKPGTVLRNMRDLVSQDVGIRPEMTAEVARKLSKKYR